MSEAGAAERQPKDGPRIYVASLSDYNAGRLVGVWVDATQDVEELEAAVQAMLAGSPDPLAEEFAIHDYESFGPIHLSEYESLERVAALGHGIAEHGEAFAAWAARQDAQAELSVERFEQSYRGTWGSLTDYADDLLADLGAETYLGSVPDWLAPYVRIDTAAFARDLRFSGDITAVEGTSGTHIFELGVEQ